MIRPAVVRFIPSPFGGDEEDRTPDPLRARQVLSQLSYTPVSWVLLPAASALPSAFESPLSRTLKTEQQSLFP